MLDIPEGYTYVRCDQYKAEDFAKMYRKGYMRDACLEYMKEHPKDIYNTDDEIAIHQILEQRRKVGMYEARHRRTTKIYRDEER